MFSKRKLLAAAVAFLAVVGLSLTVAPPANASGAIAPNTVTPNSGNSDWATNPTWYWTGSDWNVTATFVNGDSVSIDHVQLAVSNATGSGCFAVGGFDTLTLDFSPDWALKIPTDAWWERCDGDFGPITIAVGGGGGGGW